MKLILSGIFVLMILGISNSVVAQTKAVAAGNSTINTSSQRNAISTPTHTFNVQLMNVLNMIKEDEKSKKITQIQAQAFRENVKTIRIQEFQFMKENGNKQLTAIQIAQLSQRLNSLSSSL